VSAPDEPLRIGILGAARIAERAIVKPAHATGTRLVTVAARDRRRAEAFAAEHGVERTTDSYADVLADPEVDVIYNPLPNAFHGPWNLAASRPASTSCRKSRSPPPPTRPSRSAPRRTRPASPSSRDSTTSSTR
jgi:shikimate 5-dehydrogenase